MGGTLNRHATGSRRWLVRSLAWEGGADRVYRLPPFVSETEGPQHTAWRGGLGLTWACPMLSPGRRNHAPCLARDRDPMPSSSSSNRVCSFAFPVRGCPRILRQPRVTRRVRDGTRAALGSNSDREIRTGQSAPLVSRNRAIQRRRPTKPTRWATEPCRPQPTPGARLRSPPPAQRQSQAFRPPASGLVVHSTEF